MPKRKQEDVSYKGLTPMQVLFVRAYLSNGYNGTQAAKTAGYRGNQNTLGVVAHENLNKPKIDAVIKAHLNKTGMSPDEVLARIGDIARADMTDFWDIDEEGFPRFNIKRAFEEGKGHLIKTLKLQKTGLTFELHDKQTALTTLAKHHGLLKDGVTININISLVVQLVEALQSAGLNPTEIFERMIYHAHQRAKQSN